MSEIRNTYQEFELSNGQVVNLTLTFGKLNLLKSVNNELYTRFNKILFGKNDDFMDCIVPLYVAYWCANYKVGEKIYTEEEFIELLDWDMTRIKDVIDSLTQPKKK